LRDIRLIITGATAHLRANGYLLLEHGFDQGPAVLALIRAAGFTPLPARHDLAGHWRCTGGRWTGGASP
jgi:release factor glutamine methyltransferase